MLGNWKASHRSKRTAGGLIPTSGCWEKMVFVMRDTATKLGVDNGVRFEIGDMVGS